LKYVCEEWNSDFAAVTPHAGVRIEIEMTLSVVWVYIVTPHVGVRIEIGLMTKQVLFVKGHAPRGRAD